MRKESSKKTRRSSTVSGLPMGNIKPYVKQESTVSNSSTLQRHNLLINDLESKKLLQTVQIAEERKLIEKAGQVFASDETI